MINQNYLLNEMDRWQKECLDFLLDDEMTVEERTLVRINILKLTHRELGEKVKEIRRNKEVQNVSKT
jgi:hypothetical protein